MGNGMSPELKRLLAERRIMRTKPDRKLAEEELKEARSDLADAQDSLQRNKFKWATVQGYYSMFHSARALIFSRGFREKSHYALLIALKEIFRNELESSLIRAFEDGMNLRQEADYGLKFSEAGALDVVENAEKFGEKARSILKM